MLCRGRAVHRSQVGTGHVFPVPDMVVGTNNGLVMSCDLLASRLH